MFEWDEVKRRTNLAKHGVDFFSVQRFNWDSAIYFMAEEHHGERREIAVGLIGDVPHLLVYSDREDRCRVISLRRATRHETKIWLDALK
jgi:uncharacterized DUF497 family protein